MDAIQFWQQSGQEEEWLYELEARRIEDANTVLQEIAAARDETFREELETLYPILKGWR
jgi:hypothetical protein